PPDVDDFTVTTDEDTPAELDKEDFTDNFTDADNDTLASIKILVIPTDGVLTIGDDTLSVGDVIEPNRLDSLVYHPTDGFTGSDSFDWTGSDGEDDSDAATVTIDVNPVVVVNNPPDVDDFTVTTDEDTPAELDKDDFTDNFTDSDNDTLNSIRIIVIPTDGVLTIGEDTLQAGDEIVPNRLDSLVYTPTDGFSGSDSFDWTGSDGTDDSDTATVTIDVNPVVVVNNPPVGPGDTLNVNEDEVLVIGTDDLNYSDDDTDPLDFVEIIQPPVDGILYLDEDGDNTYDPGEEIEAGDTIGKDRWDAGDVQFIPGDDENGDGYAEIGIRVNDGTDDADTDGVFVINVLPVNDPPMASDNTLTVAEDSILTITTDDLGYSDPEGDALVHVTIESLPTDGTLFLDLNVDGDFDAGEEVAVGDTVVVVDMDFNNLNFLPDPDENGSPFGSFDFNVFDGTDAATEDNTITINVTPVNDKPAVEDIVFDVDAGDTLHLTKEDFTDNFDDPDGDTLVEVEITGGPDGGVLILDGDTLSVGDIIPVDRLDDIIFVPTDGFEGTGGFDWNGSDGSEYAEDDARGDITVNPVDSDGDGIPDDIEIGDDPDNPIDTDGDGDPDYLDDDSDNDGIKDGDEAGDDPENPVDSDGDGDPDFQDEDSDGDGLPDDEEAGDDPENPVDSDGDGDPDFRDEDSDGDGLPDDEEAGDDPENPVDSDGDGTPDHLDDDSDNDGIPDDEEAGDDPENPNDSDGDGIPDHLDDDSDNDGTPDSEDDQPTIPEEVLPNQGISPNGDGNNDFWVIEGIEAHPDNIVAIFNRWGNKVFEIENYDNDTRVWSGESLEGVVAGSRNGPDGVYFYVIEFADGAEPLSGYVVIKR
ncbi:MAG TPA: hypothetical protein DCR93_03675, partial [Cytophagales bacterium]|nr:hypothetical protein [Cytophagales bacterium]